MEADEILNKEIKRNENLIIWKKLKTDLDYKRGKKFTALENLIKIFELEPIPENAYDVVVLKTELGDSSGNFQSMQKF